MKVAVVGPICKDYITIDGQTSCQIGGCAYYIVNALYHLGGQVVPFISFDKSQTDWVRENFKGIDIEHIEVEGTLEFHADISSSDPNKRSIKVKYVKNVIEPTKELLDKLEKFDYVVIDSLFYDNTPKELFAKLKHKNLVSGNFGMFSYPKGDELEHKHPENLVEVLPYLKYLFLDISEAKFVSGKDSLEETGKFFLDNGLENMIITEGSHGSNIFTKDNHYRIPAFPPRQLVDPTGAGDTYLGAYIRAIELFDTTEERGKFAAMVSTVSLEKKGAFDGTLDEVTDRLNNKNKL